MSIQLKFTSIKTSLVADSGALNTGKVRGAGKHQASSGASLRPAGDGGFKKKLDALGKAGTLKKEVKAAKGETRPKGEEAAQAAPVIHEKKILSLFEKSGTHHNGAHQTGALKNGGKGKGLIQARSISLERDGVETTQHGKDSGKLETAGFFPHKSGLKSLAPTRKVLSQGKAVLSQIHKGHSSSKKGAKGEEGHIRVAHAAKGLKEYIASELPEKRHIDMGLERTLSGKTAPEPSGGSSLKAAPLKAQEAATTRVMINPLKGLVLKGASKKRVAVVSARSGAKQRGRKAAAEKKGSVKRPVLLSRRAVSKAGSRLFTESLRGSGSKGANHSEGGLPVTSSVLVDSASQGGQALTLTKGGDKAALKNPSALFNTNAPAELETASRQGRAFKTAMKGALQGRDTEMIKKASDGVLLSLRQADKKIVLSLDPEELGHMEITVRLHNGLVDASILVDNADVMAMMNANGASLKDQLERQGLMLGGLEVALNHKDGSARNNENLQGEGYGHNGRGGEAMKGADSAGEEPLVAAMGLQKAAAQGRLDLFI